MRPVWARDVPGIRQTPADRLPWQKLVGSGPLAPRPGGGMADTAALKAAAARRAGSSPAPGTM